MEYNFKEIEQKWQQHWKQTNAYKVSNESNKPKYYVLDMFPYPSGAGLHVGHPLGYIASDICARYKKLKGFNVLHPMGFDSFGLPAEQYALETGQHPAVTTEKNIATFKNQLDKIGFCYDWDREVKTSTPQYYKWTQWIFLQLFNSYYDKKENKAKSISTLVKTFETEGNKNVPNANSKPFSADEWNAFDEKQQQTILMNHRLAFCAYGEVNWCEVLGTVLANDEVINGVSERGGHPVVKKKMRQWYWRITDYADRLLEGLEHIDFSDSMKEMQKNWIGKSEGAEITFELHNSPLKLTVYTTRPDTIFGVDFMTLAPDLELVQQIKTPEQAAAVDEYIAYVKSRSDVDRMAEKKITGCFTGAYAIHPFNNKKIPVWISEYVLAGYGTGAVMAVPCGDERDFKFAQHFNIPVTNIIGDHFTGLEANPTKDATLQNSDFLNGCFMNDAVQIVINKIEASGIGKRKVNYKMRDAGFSRQRYWGEPFPIIWNDDIAIALQAQELPLELPHIEKYKPGPDGQGPLANITEWVNAKRETSTMPGYAGSSWYFLRYMDPHNNQTFCDRKVSDYWRQVDLYIGGTEHAVGHLLYSRFCTKILYDLGYIGFDEPFKKLINQGMIQGSSRFVYRLNFVNVDTANKKEIFISKNKLTEIEHSENGVFKLLIEIRQNAPDYFTAQEEKIFGFIPQQIRVDVNFVDGFELDIKKYKTWKNGEYENAVFILEDDGKYICGAEVEKMSKSKYNTVNPDELCNKYGADTFRMYEMFLGPIEAAKPWDTKGIEGVHRFLKKLWRLFFDDIKGSIWTNEKPSDAELKILHKTIKKIEDDTERFSFNTAVSAFMVCVNELTDLKCNKKEILQPLLILLAPYAPHIAEELYHQLNALEICAEENLATASYPVFDPSYLTETSKEYPISINGKHRTNIAIALNAAQSDVEKIVLENNIVQKWIEGKLPKKIIYVKGKMVNIVV